MKYRTNPLLQVPAAAMAALALTTAAHALTYNWQGDESSDFNTPGNWVEEAWDQWGDYHFGGTPTTGTVDVDAGFGWRSINLDSGLTTDIVIGGSQPIIMATNWSIPGTITIASDSKNLTINNGYNSNGAVTWNVGANRTLTFNNILSDWNGTASLVKDGAGTAVLTGGNTYTGTTTVSGGTLVLARASWTFENVNRGGVTVGSGATLRADNSVANHLNGLTLNGGTVEAINSSGNGDWGDFFLTGDVTATGTSYLNADIALRKTNVDFNVSSGGILNVGGNLHNGAYFGIYGGSPATVSKSGDGTMVVSGTHTYTGATTVSVGTLVVNGNISTSATTVANGATLGGTGTVGTTTVNGSFAPGNSIGTINVIGTLDLNGISNFEIDPTLGVGLDRAADLANVTGAVSFGGILNVLYGGSASDFTNGMTFNLFDATLGFTDNFTTINLPSLTGGLTWQNDLATNGSITVVPEPDAALLGGLGLLCLLRRRR